MVYSLATRWQSHVYGMVTATLARPGYVQPTFILRLCCVFLVEMIGKIRKRKTGHGLAK